nr:hypothetical protein [Streptococcus gallolyticus]
MTGDDGYGSVTLGNVGDYTLVLNLPEGYEIYEAPAFTVLYGKQNRVKFSVIDKTGLISEINATAN